MLLLGATPYNLVQFRRNPVERVAKRFRKLFLNGFRACFLSSRLRAKLRAAISNPTQSAFSSAAHSSSDRRTEMIDQVAAQMAPADDDYVILHLAGEHTASLQRIVMLQCLQNENGNDDPEQNTLAPEGIKNP